MTIVGLDLHKRYMTACALDPSGSLLGEVWRMPVSLEALSNFMSDFPVPASPGGGQHRALGRRGRHGHLSARRVERPSNHDQGGHGQKLGQEDRATDPERRRRWTGIVAPYFPIAATEPGEADVEVARI